MGTVRTPNAVVFVDEDSIRERAYLIWESRGRPEATSEDNWHLARAELLAEAEARLCVEVAASETGRDAPAKAKRRKRSAPSKQLMASGEPPAPPHELPGSRPLAPPNPAGPPEAESRAVEPEQPNKRVAKPKVADARAAGEREVGKPGRATPDRFAVELSTAGGRSSPTTGARAKSRTKAAAAPTATASENPHDTPLPPAARAPRKKTTSSRKTKSLRPSAERGGRRSAK
jgi:hypothetical protein